MIELTRDLVVAAFGLLSLLGGAQPRRGVVDLLYRCSILKKQDGVP